MKSLFKLFTSVLFVFAQCQSACAQEYYSVSSCPENCCAMPWGFDCGFNNFLCCDLLDGWYLSVGVGANWLHLNEVDDIKLHTTTGTFVSTAVGYRPCDYVKAEGEFCYRYNKATTVDFFDDRIASQGHVKSYSGFFNAIFDYPLCFNWLRCGITPFIGGGIGYSYQHVNAAPYVFSPHSSNGFAGQFMVGIELDLVDCVDIGLEYRYHRGQANYLYDQTLNTTFSFCF